MISYTVLYYSTWMSHGPKAWVIMISGCKWLWIRMSKLGYTSIHWDGMSEGAKSWVVDGCKWLHPYQVALVLLHKLVKKFHSSWARLVTLVRYNAIHVFWQANWPMDLNLPRKNNHATVSILHMLTWPYRWSCDYIAYLQIQHRYICIK